MCNCKTKVQFEIDSGGLLSIEPLEVNKCHSFNECLDCTEIDDKLEDGIYQADLNCEVYPVRYAECIEYYGESVLENIIKSE
jgi:hypothetical protein